MNKFLFLIILIFSSSWAFAESCETMDNDCEYYSCVEEQRHCGKKGYLLGFGKKYCLKFSEQDYRFSKKGRKWLNDVRECLIDNLDKSEAVSCKEFKREQFRAHVPCYVNTGYCELSRRDRFAVKKVIYKSLWRPSLIWSGMRVVLNCRF
ncbi:hypothetical protein [Halobacteriovorax sp.]|uniref:hypothetical protein n=1 Tax=Halobacteriovorax sp. TaxID=2020862 RepID=UPI003565A3F8